MPILNELQYLIVPIIFRYDRRSFGRDFDKDKQMNRGNGRFGDRRRTESKEDEPEWYVIFNIFNTFDHSRFLVFFATSFNIFSTMLWF